MERTKTKRIIIHHTLSGDVSASTIDLWHKEKGYSEIGYHFVIRKDGTIEQGRNLGSVGSHSKGKNSDSIGIVLTGDFSKEQPTMEQYAELSRLVKCLRSYYKRVS